MTDAASSQNETDAPSEDARKIDALLADRDRLAAMASAARAMGRPDAAARLADELLALRRS